MGRTKKEKTEDTLVEDDVRVPPETETDRSKEIKDLNDLSSFEITCLEDFEVYNKAARRLNRPVKVPDESYHKKVKVKFQRFDQPDNVLKACVRNKDIEWKGQLKPGGIYHLPVPVVSWLNSLSVPIFKQVNVESEGGETLSETRQVGEQSRFSAQILEF